MILSTLLRVEGADDSGTDDDSDCSDSSDDEDEDSWWDKKEVLAPCALVLVTDWYIQVQVVEKIDSQTLSVEVAMDGTLHRVHFLNQYVVYETVALIID